MHGDGVKNVKNMKNRSPVGFIVFFTFFMPPARMYVYLYRKKEEFIYSSIWNNVDY